MRTHSPLDSAIYQRRYLDIAGMSPLWRLRAKPGFGRPESGVPNFRHVISEATKPEKLITFNNFPFVNGSPQIVFSKKAYAFRYVTTSNENKTGVGIKDTANGPSRDYANGMTVVALFQIDALPSCPYTFYQQEGAYNTIVGTAWDGGYLYSHVGLKIQNGFYSTGQAFISGPHWKFRFYPGNSWDPPDDRFRRFAECVRPAEYGKSYLVSASHKAGMSILRENGVEIYRTATLYTLRGGTLFFDTVVPLGGSVEENQAFRNGLRDYTVWEAATFEYAASPLQLEAIEGCVAWNNNAQHLLPGNHKFRNTPPLIGDSDGRNRWYV